MSNGKSAVPLVDTIPSAQSRADGEPRFHVTPWGDRYDWRALSAMEGDAGVEASLRLFLDAQLESGDVMVDLSPGAGFVALAAATAQAEPHVISLVQDEAHEQALRDAADGAGAFIECVVQGVMHAEDLAGLVADRRLDGHRVFVHADAHATAQWLEAFSALADAGVLVAWCVGGASTADAIALAHASLVAHGFTPHVLAEIDGDAQLFPALADAGECVALHRSVQDAAGGEHEQNDDDVALGGDMTGDAPVRGESVHGDSVREASVRGDREKGAAGPTAHPPVVYRGTHTSALQFIAPFCRTGYGIAGAHLLRALMLRGATVNFFPLGTLDTSVLPFAGIADALAGQDNYDPALPSVRLSQQFDLAMHVGRGPRVGFPIFELTRFNTRERHHLASQDQLLVCSEWARSVLLENGVSRTPIHIVPLGVDRGVFHERLDAGRTRDETVFLQVGKLESRKGQLELLRAFEAAFTPTDAVRLVLACHNPFMDSDSFHRATAPFRKSPMARRITLHAKPFATHSDIAKLMASADCGVFVSRAEGWNLEALEMLSVGRAVIATNYSAHTEYLTDANARLIDIDALTQVSGAVEGARWAEWGDAQHEQLVAELRAVHEARRSGMLTRNEAGIETAKRYSWDDSAVALLKALNG